jgi:hypothetical protein
LPDGIFARKNDQFWFILEGLGVVNFGGGQENNNWKKRADEEDRYKGELTPPAPKKR